MSKQSAVAFLVIFTVCIVCIGFASAIPLSARTDGNWTVELRMPQVAHTKKDIRICTSVALPRRNGYIVGFEHVGPPGVVHHMFAYGCAEPAGTTWECGLSGPRCKTGSGLLMYAWANDAPPLRLPQGVGYELSDSLRYVVAEMHYGHPSDVPDSSGMDIRITSASLPYHAGIYVLLAPGYERIPGNTDEYKIEEQCTFNQVPFTAFAYRVHTHGAGVRVWGEKMEKGNRNKITILGDRDPKLAQAFIPMPNEVTISKGDVLHAECIFTNQGHGSIHIGGGMTDEMCNFYIMGYAPRSFRTIACSAGNEFPL